MRDHGQGAGHAIEPGEVFGVVEVARALARAEVGPEDVRNDLDHVEVAARLLDQAFERGLEGHAHAELGQGLHDGSPALSGNGR